MALQWEVETCGGTVPVAADEEARDITVILAHGAGGTMEQKTVLWLADLLRSCDARVVRFNFLYKAQGRGLPDRAPVLMETYRAVISSVREKLAPSRFVIGGHSMGGRMASMLAAEGAFSDGLLLFGYPLHPAGQPGKLRDAHLPTITIPTLQLNGTEDALCTPDLMRATLERIDPSVWRMVWIEGADHSYAVKASTGRRRPDVEADIRNAVGPWLRSLP